MILGILLSVEASIPKGTLWVKELPNIERKNDLATSSLLVKVSLVISEILDMALSNRIRKNNLKSSPFCREVKNKSAISDLSGSEMSKEPFSARYMNIS